MKALCQRVAGASVAIDGETVARIDQGLLVFLGVVRDDTETQAEKLAAKTLALRVRCFSGGVPFWEAVERLQHTHPSAR